MTLNVEYTKNGKPNILYKNHKYRESYSLKGGDVVWRCLGRSCAASIKTDPNRTTVIEANGKHSGQHPVTMRSLSSPSTPKMQALDMSSGSSAAESVANGKVALPRSPSASSDLVRTPLTTPLSLQTCSNATSTPVFSESEMENKALKEEVLKLKGQLKTLLDHSIENDLRLLEYTDQVFAPRSQSSNKQTTDPACKIDDCVPSTIVEPPNPSPECLSDTPTLLQTPPSSTSTTMVVTPRDVNNQLSAAKERIVEFKKSNRPPQETL